MRHDAGQATLGCIWFQSTHSLRSATYRPRAWPALRKVSIHALLAECDSASWVGVSRIFGFNPRTPCGVRLSCGFLNFLRLLFRTPCGVRRNWRRCAGTILQFQSTHSLRSATIRPSLFRHLNFVSIHALLAECDWLLLESKMFHVVSIHALLAECDSGKDSMVPIRHCFNPRTPCGVRLRPTLYIATQQSKSYFAPTSLKRPSLHGCSF